MKSAELHWSLNGVYQGSKKYTGNLPCDFIDTITLGSYIHRVNDYDTVTVWIKMPNNVADKAVNDDTLQRISLGCAKASSGTFAVGPNSQYKTLKEAMDGIYACGAGGDITIEFENGTYIIDSVLRLNTAFMNGHHLTFTSKSKNRDSVTISYKASITAPGMITLNNTENVTFSYLTIHNSSTSNSNTVCLNGPIDNVTFYHCVLRRTNGTLILGSRSMCRAEVWRPTKKIWDGVISTPTSAKWIWWRWCWIQCATIRYRPCTVSSQTSLASTQWPNLLWTASTATRWSSIMSGIFTNQRWRTASRRLPSP